MISKLRQFDAKAPAVVIDIGNTSVNIATWHADQVKTPLSAGTADQPEIQAALAAHYDAMPKGHTPATVIASVVPDTTKRIGEYVQTTLDRDVLVIGDAIPLPMDVAVTDKQAIGVDRVCAAFAAYDKLQAACTVVDFGTAVTVDLVDDEGILLGGAILAGLKMQLRALNEQTAVLPSDVAPAFPDLPYGRDTVEAMQTGACRGLAGAVRGLVEAYASYLNRWPQVVATGGDLALMAPYCDYLDTQVNHLTLRGIGRAYSQHLAAHGA
ncbi:MAG: type III pantothenate kinase [Phycisphaerales bacterium]|nr:MAG: type III pantothenate kinase [Phycisphaerales bacterium]